MILAIVQARMGSSRLPGKVMREIQNTPLIGYMLNRLAHCQCVDKTIVATPNTADNDLLADYVKSLGYEVFRGSENDVLERFTLAARRYKPEAVVRLTGDCILIDASIVDSMIKLYKQTGADYAWVDSSFAEGLDADIISHSALEAVYSEATLASEREHLTQFIHKHPERFLRIPLKNELDDSAYRIVVDDPEDFKVVGRIIEYFEERNADVYYPFTEIRKFLDKHPELVALNSHIIRNEGLIKSMANDKKIKLRE